MIPQFTVGDLLAFTASIAILLWCWMIGDNMGLVNSGTFGELPRDDEGLYRWANTSGINKAIVVREGERITLTGRCNVMARRQTAVPWAELGYRKAISQSAERTVDASYVMVLPTVLLCLVWIPYLWDRKAPGSNAGVATADTYRNEPK